MKFCKIFNISSETNKGQKKQKTVMLGNRAIKPGTKSIINEDLYNQFRFLIETFVNEKVLKVVWGESASVKNEEKIVETENKTVNEETKKLVEETQLPLPIEEEESLNKEYKPRSRKKRITNE